MKRYVEMFLRYWFIAIIPVLALPAAEFLAVRHMPGVYTGSTLIEVQSRRRPPCWAPRSGKPPVSSTPIAYRKS